MDAINLRSDTQTLPTDEMYEAMARAPLGDDVMGNDPTVNRLQEIAAARLGKEAGLFVPSGTMGNLVALMAVGGHGDEIIVDPDAHMYYYEGGAFCSVAGFTPRPVPSDHGVLDPDVVEAAIRPPSDHLPTPKVLALENTHNRGGGTVTPLDVHRRLCEVGHAHGLWVHLDGARIFNAAVVLGVDARELARDVDSVMFCVSKGLSAPAGSLVVGPEDFIRGARRARKRLGGAMRQAGVLAAAAIVAIEKMVDRLAEDHANARRLAEGVAAIDGLDVDLAHVQSNMVYVDVSPLGLGTAAFIAVLEPLGLLASGRPPRHVRMVAHRHITAADVDRALAILQDAAARAKSRAST